MTKVVPFEQRSRQHKRHTPVKVKLNNGNWVEMSPMSYAKSAEEQLPVMLNVETGKNFDHYKNLMQCYLNDGAEGMNEYSKTVWTTYKKQYKKHQKALKKAARQASPSIWKNLKSVLSKD